MQALYAVPVANVEEAQNRLAAIGQPNTFSIALAATAEGPATHMGSYNASISEEHHAARVAAFAEEPDLNVLTAINKPPNGCLAELSLVRVEEPE